MKKVSVELAFGSSWLPGAASPHLPIGLQGAIISFDEAHSPANRTSLPLPRLNISHLAYNWGGCGGGGNTDRLRHPLAFYEPLPLRFASPPLEASPELRTPQFCTCTVPVVMFSMVRLFHAAGRCA